MTTECQSHPSLWYLICFRDGRISYPDPAGFPLSGESCLWPDCMFYTGSDLHNLPMQRVSCLTDVELTGCALLEPANQ